MLHIITFHSGNKQLIDCEKCEVKESFNGLSHIYFSKIKKPRKKFIMSYPMHNIKYIERL